MCLRTEYPKIPGLRSLLCGQSRVEAQFARMRLRLNFISDDICLRTVVWTEAKKRTLVYMI